MIAGDDKTEFGDDDVLAAEYVVGVLPVTERAVVARRIDEDQAFSRLVNHWVARLSPLDASYPSIEAPAFVKAAIDRRLFSGTAAQAKPNVGLWSSLSFWRGLAVAALAALVVTAGASFLREAPAPQQQLVASLAADGSAVHFLAVYDPRTGSVGLSHVAGEREAGKDFELWMIEGQNAPKSMGVIPAGSAAHLTVDEASRAKLAAGAVLAISLEPAGGSPTGQPTGPVVAAGDLRSI